jgi:hypothetical protein
MTEVIVIEPGRLERDGRRDLWRYRELFRVLAWRDLAMRCNVIQGDGVRGEPTDAVRHRAQQPRRVRLDHPGDQDDERRHAVAVPLVHIEDICQAASSPWRRCARRCTTRFSTSVTDAQNYRMHSGPGRASAEAAVPRAGTTCQSLPMHRRCEGS